MPEEGRLDQANPTLKQRSLLHKYEIPIDHLSFEYIEDCKDIKELEKIVRVLRSGEEGFYPQLQSRAEECLRALSPNSRQLRVEQPVLTRSDMSSDQWNSINSDISIWQAEMSLKDLRLTEDNNNAADELTLPPVRQPSMTNSVADEKACENTSNLVRTKGVSDYSSWNKYDADTELLKMDLEEEKKREKMIKEKELEEKIKAEKERLDIIVKEAGKLFDTERQVLAEQEKTRGNEYYQANEIEEAIKFYTASIAMWPTAKAYNNRAACHLKLCNYSATLQDANRALAKEPGNVKALFRRGLAFKHEKQFREALVDMKQVLEKEPKHALARRIVQELLGQIKTSEIPRRVRLMYDEGYLKPKRIVETWSTDPIVLNNNDPNCYEVTERGLPKVMWVPSAEPRFLKDILRNPEPESPPQTPTSLPCQTPASLPRQTPASLPRQTPASLPRQTPASLPRQTPASLPRQTPARIVELSDEAVPPSRSTKLEIVEVDTSNEVDNFYKPKKCVVIDKRTQKTVVNENINFLNSKIELLNDFSQGSSSGSKDSGMDEECDINPLLDNTPEPLSNL